MTPSDKLLENYTFTGVSVNCIMSDEGPADSLVKLEDITFEIQHFGSDDEPDVTIVRLKVSTREDVENLRCRYTFSLEAFARIRYVPDAKLPPELETQEKMLVINAASILYGAFRERLNLLTSSMVWGQAILPPAQFNTLKKLSSTRLTPEAPEDDPVKG